MSRRTDVPLRARLSRFGRDLARFLAVRLVLICAGAAVGALVGVAFAPRYGWDALWAGALIGAVSTLVISIVAVGGKSSVREAGEDILGFLLAFVLACAACAAVGTLVGLLLVPWQGWSIVGIAAGIGAVLPFTVLLSLGSGSDPTETFRGFLRDTVTWVSKISSRFPRRSV